MTKYEMISNTIRQRIRDGVYPEDTLIPDQVTLSKEFKVSRMTVKKAMDILEVEGLILRKRGAGTTVRKNALQDDMTADIMDYEGLTKQLEGKEVVSKTISFKIDFPSEKVQDKLSIGKTDPIYKIERLRIVDGKPYIIEHMIMNAQLIPGIDDEVLANSVYQYIHNDLNLEFGGAHRIISADKSTDFDQEHLHCLPDDPILQIEQVVYLEDGTPFEYSKSRSKYTTRTYKIIDLN